MSNKVYNSQFGAGIASQTNNPDTYTVKFESITLIVKGSELNQHALPMPNEEEKLNYLSYLNKPISSFSDVNTTWNKRYRNYIEKLKYGGLHDVIDVYKNLQLLKNTKDLSFGERKMIEQSKYVIESVLDINLG